MDEGFPLVDIIVVNYNGRRHLPSCLASLGETDYSNFSIIVVDNNSTDGSPEWVREHVPEVTLVQNSSNLGFGSANMIGVRKGSAPLVALLNSDTRVTPNWLKPLVVEIQRKASIGAVCSKLLFMGNPRVLNGAGGGMNFVGYGYDIGIFEVDNERFDKPGEVFFPCAASCLLKKSILEKIGGFDEAFFMYHEDVDLGWRLHLQGYGVRYVPDSVVYHAFGGTSTHSGGMGFRNRLGERHALRSLLKNYEWLTLARVLPIFLGLGFRNAFKTHSMDFFRSINWNLKKLPDTMRQRKKTQASRCVSDQELMPLIWQKVPLPFAFPDYETVTLESFSEGGHKRSWIKMAHNDEAALGYGWHAVELDFRDGITRYRWSKEEAVFFLWNPFETGVLRMEVLTLSKTLGGPRRFSISINGNEPHEFTVESEGWELVSLNHSISKGPLEIKIAVEKAWRPDDKFENGDNRLLGIGVKEAAIVPGEPFADTFSGISVIIPTFNRVKKLLDVLRALEGQTLDREAFEVVVVDDGSTDSTQREIKAFAENTALEIVTLKQSNKKQGAARNLGIQYAKRPLICFIGDDIIPDPKFLEEHMAFHKRHNVDGHAAVIGYTKWSPGSRVTPFMRFIGEHGHQFGYSLIEGNGPLKFNFFYTSNLSIPKAFLTEMNPIFEEGFETYGWEDIELGYRLEMHGMRLLYDPHAIAYHDHPTDILSFCRRQFIVGKASRTFLEKHPELDWFLGNPEQLKKAAKWRTPTRLLAATGHLLDKAFHLPLPHAYYKTVLQTFYATGCISMENKY